HLCARHYGAGDADAEVVRADRVCPVPAREAATSARRARQLPLCGGGVQASARVALQHRDRRTPALILVVWSQFEGRQARLLRQSPHTSSAWGCRADGPLRPNAAPAIGTWRAMLQAPGGTTGTSALLRSPATSAALVAA